MTEKVRFEAHPRIPAPTEGMVQEIMAENSCSRFEALLAYKNQRQQIIEAERKDAFNYSYIPTIWTVVWSLLDWPYWPQQLIAEACEEYGCKDVWEFMRRMREKLGFSHPVTCLWVSGANGSGKSELVSYMVNAQMAAKADQLVYVLSTTEKGSVDAGIHAKLYRHIPKPWINVGKGSVGYVSYKAQNGFSNSAYMFPNGSRLAMKFYSQDPEVECEGFDAHAIFADESIPAGWFERLPARVGRRNGFIMHTNTPQAGYTDVVHQFMEGATVTRWSCGYMLPKDGQDAVQAGALGLSEKEYAMLLEAHAQRPPLPPWVPESRAEDCWEWLNAEPGWETLPRAIKDAPAVQEGTRLFEAVPRVAKCADRNRAVVWFHSADNPYGYPRNLVSDMAGKDSERIKCRLYGVVSPQQQSVFSAFRRDKHVIKPLEIPEGGEYFFSVDPAPGRNPFMMWAKKVAGNLYVYREFPGSWNVPSIGNPGPWAKQSGKKNGVNDGAQGDAVKSFGWGNAKYKAMIAWLEGWDDYLEWSGGNRDFPTNAVGDVMWPTVDEVFAWRDPAAKRSGAIEPIGIRIMDPRGGMAPHVSTEGTSTPLGDWSDLGFEIEPAFSGTVVSGVDAIINAIDADRLFISEDCTNLIWSMEVWKNVDGDKGATKDPIDCLRYIFSSGLMEREYSDDSENKRPHRQYYRPPAESSSRPRQRSRVRVC